MISNHEYCFRHIKIIFSIIISSLFLAMTPLAEELSDCDKLGSMLIDDARSGIPRKKENYDAAAVIDACNAALTLEPENARFLFQLGVALLIVEPRQFDEALKNLKRSADLGYRAALDALLKLAQDSEKYRK